MDNARYALNAANARWGSLYDALYGSDAIPEDAGAERGASYNPTRGECVIDWANGFLDDAVPLASGHWGEVAGFGRDGAKLEIALTGGASTALVEPSQFGRYRRNEAGLTKILITNNGLHIDLEIGPEHPIGRQHPAGVRDVVLESAVSTIMGCEDSVAAVDAADKAVVSWTKSAARQSISKNASAPPASA